MSTPQPDVPHTGGESPSAPAPGEAGPGQRRDRRSPGSSRVGRNLPAAISVGLSLLAVLLAGLFLWPMGFVLIAVAAAILGVWEVFRALEAHGTRVPVVPILGAAVAIPATAYFAGQEAQLFALLASCAAVLLWQSLEHPDGAARSVFAGVFLVLWVPFLIGYAVLPLHASASPPGLGLWPGGTVPSATLELVLTLLLVVANDTFGYIVGASLGKHPMAPKISPKKSWEGFAGSVAGAMVVGVLGAVFLLGRPWWVGVVLAVVMVGAATAGDLAESMVKRELGIKDMSSILPGHGGMMDRLDSILFATPAAYLVFNLLAGT
ncbi:phosphatidate cytidylyltransferase [Sinomonas notoginsengisoli]|uniref:phosphatidate cytidylyltransferase n=1 Tax=Sinomonas notoginsengisoli TaxID=1457311 RepID=UPI001F2A244F|nr:phosphatidate cytidylyltransferase [Sinomonas notoginsengisoli]